jgi:hypothetical protein
VAAALAACSWVTGAPGAVAAKAVNIPMRVVVALMPTRSSAPGAKLLGRQPVTAVFRERFGFVVFIAPASILSDSV